MRGGHGPPKLKVRGPKWGLAPQLSQTRVQNIEFCPKIHYKRKFLVWSDQTHELVMEREQRGTSLLTWEYLSEC